jgi:hypothetical protein
MRRDSHQNPPLSTRLEHEVQVAMLEIAHASVHEARGPARCAAREVVAFDERGAKSTHRAITRDPSTGDTAADNQHVESLSRETAKANFSRFHARSVSHR